MQFHCLCVTHTIIVFVLCICDLHIDMQDPLLIQDKFLRIISLERMEKYRGNTDTYTERNNTNRHGSRILSVFYKTNMYFISHCLS